ncbi:30S ribosomal protein S7 [Candidatus Beckwithbacteria bacterium]|nr:30S ribosomal protein S7 [Candidatus Beckwithbacteria bacterium]
MPRSGRIKKRLLEPDPIYGNRLVTRIINRMMLDGKKDIATKQFYKALDILAQVDKESEPVDVLRRALDNIKPVMEVRSRRIGGAAYQVPMPVKGDRRETLAIRWLITCARKRPNSQFHTFAEKLAAELKDALNHEGEAVKKRDITHKAAEANKAFAHFRW